MYTGALQMTCLYLVIDIFHLELSASTTEMRGDHLSMKDKGPEKKKKNNKALSCMHNKGHDTLYNPIR